MPCALVWVKTVTRRMVRSRLTSRAQVTCLLTCELFLPFHLLTGVLCCFTVILLKGTVA